MRGMIAMIAVGILLAACAPPQAGTADLAQPAESLNRPQTLVAAVRVEPVSLASKPLQDSGQTVRFTTRVFNAELDSVDGNGRPRPYLAESLPQLNSADWRIFPDGRMETIHRLRPNLTWHDETPLSAEDFVFAWRVYSAPELGQPGSRPQRLIEEALAPDALTLVIRWRAPFPDAGTMRDQFQPLPRHLLARSFAEEPPNTFALLPFWSVDYVGLGPYRLTQWLPGSWLEGTAFDGHVLGRSRIDRLQVRFIPDENTALTNLLAGSIHLATDRTLRFEHGQILRAQWRKGDGTVMPALSAIRYVLSQWRPEVANPPAILDVRVRRAIAHTLNRQGLNDGLFDGQAVLWESALSPGVPYAAEIERSITHYPHDPRRAEQLMAEVGYVRDRDGWYASGGARLSAQISQLAGAQYEKEVNILLDGWRGAGLDFQSFFITPEQLRDGRLRASFPFLTITQGGGSTEERLDFLSPELIPTAANRWNGNNRGGWVSHEYQRVWEAFNTTLERAERNRQAIQMLAILSEELPMIPLYFNLAPTAYAAQLIGPEQPAQIPDPLISWNIHEWDWRR